MLWQIEAEAGGLSTTTLSLLVLLLSLAASTVLLYRRYSSRRQLMRRVEELEALSAAGRALVAAELDVEALCELIHREAGKIIANETFQVGLFQGEQYRIQVWYREGERQPPQSFALGQDAGLVGWVRDHQQPLLVGDFATEQQTLPAQPGYQSENPPRSALFIPLVSGGQTLGILAAQSQEPYRFRQNDLRRLTILANQAAAAIANAYLYDEERSRAAQLEMVSHIARQVNAIADPDEIVEQVVQLIHQQFGYHPVNIYGFQEEEQGLLIQASSAPVLVGQVLRLGPGEGLVGAALQSHQTVLVNDVRQEPRYLAHTGVEDVDRLSAGTCAEIVIPLVVNDEPLGVLDVHSQEVGAFGRRTETALEVLASQVAIAIHKVRQFDRQRQQAWLTTAQLQVAEAISRSEELEQLADSVLRLIPLLAGSEACCLLLYDSDLGLYRPQAIAGADEATRQAFLATTLPTGSWTALDAVHVAGEPFTSQVAPPWQPSWAPLALLPLLAKGELLGVLGVLPPPEREAQRELLHSISLQLAQALDSALLDLAQQEEAWVNTALLQVAEAVNSLINLEEILHTIVRFVPMLVGVDYCLVLVLNEAGDAFRAGPSYGLKGMGRGLLESFEIPRSELPVVQAREEGLLTPAPTYYELALPPWLRTSLQSETASAFPLHARNRLVGVLLVGSWSDRHPLAGRRLNILAGIAHQAATALANDHLYQEAAEREKLTRELEVARTIQASLIPPGAPPIPGCSVASSWQAARMVSGDFYDFLPLRDGRWGIVVADVADKGMAAAIFMAVSRTILRAVAFGRSSPAETLQRANELIFNDTQSDLFVTVFYAIWDAARQRLTYASGGHNPALLVRSDGSQALLQSAGMALGVLENIVVEEESIDLQAGDVVTFYTDGVTEAINEDYDEFGLDRLRLTVQKARALDAAGISQAIAQAVREHAGETAQFDDITQVVIKHEPGEPDPA